MSPSPASPNGAPARIPASEQAYAYDATLPPALVVESGATVVFETSDARDGALADRPVGTGFELPRPTPGRGNPLTGPLAIAGVAPGDALVVDVLHIACGGPGWGGAHAHVNPLTPGRIPVSLARSCAIGPEGVAYADGVRLPLAPMVGCIGTAPARSAPNAGEPGRHGGNLDHPILAAGSRVYLRAEVPEALLFIGDVHAAQGDGELSGVAIEVPAEVTVRVSSRPGSAPDWPWVVTRDRIAVLTSAAEFADARREAVSAMLDLIEARLGLAPAEALGLISAAGDLRIGQAFGGMDLTLRLELPRLPGLELEPADPEEPR